jgi:hypothetical protein
VGLINLCAGNSQRRKWPSDKSEGKRCELDGRKWKISKKRQVGDGSKEKAVKAAYSLEEGSNHLAFPISAVLEQPPEKVKQKLRSEYFFSRLQLLRKYQRCYHRRPLKLFRTIQIWDFRVSKRVLF